MFKLLFISALAVAPLSSFANMTSASIFKEMKSTNPGTISGRPAATFSVLAKKDTIEVEQADLSAGPLNAGSKFESSINITNTTLFYGGKGGGITTELLVESGAGGKTDKLTESTTNSLEYETESEVTNLNLGIGLFDGFGISLISLTAKDKQNYSGTINGTPLAVDATTDVTLTGITLGGVVNLGVDIGFFYQKADFKNETSLQLASGDDDDTESVDRMGIGVGYSTGKFRAEAGYVKNVEAQDGGDDEEFNPAMAEFTVETTIGKLSVGYTGRYYMDGFYRYNNVLYNVLAYSNNRDNRLENTFNFSYGSDSSGHSFSGSFSAGSVESKQGQQLISNDTAEYDTTTTSQSMSLSYAYIF